MESRKRALDIRHLWKMPDIVAEFLENGDERLRQVAMTASCFAGAAPLFTTGESARKEHAALWAADAAYWACAGNEREAMHAVQRALDWAVS